MQDYGQGELTLEVHEISGHLFDHVEKYHLINENEFKIFNSYGNVEIITT